MNQIRSTRSARALAATVALSLTACAGYSTAPGERVVVQTTKTVYEIPGGSTGLTIEAILTNTLDEPLLLDGIGRDFLRLEKRVGGAWRLAYSPVYILPIVPDIELPAGQSRQLTIGLSLATSSNTFPRLEYDIPGAYRAVFGFRVAGPKGFEVYSNEFELRETN